MTMKDTPHFLELQNLTIRWSLVSYPEHNFFFEGGDLTPLQGIAYILGPADRVVLMFYML